MKRVSICHCMARGLRTRGNEESSEANEVFFIVIHLHVYWCTMYIPICMVHSFDFACWAGSHGDVLSPQLLRVNKII